MKRALEEPGTWRIGAYLLARRIPALRRWISLPARGGAHRRSAQVPLRAEGESAAIPKLIFQTWKTRSELPANFDYWSASFSRLNPSFTHVLWDDLDNRQFIEQRFEWFLGFYDKYPREIYRADIVRAFFLFEFGGLYADLDTECLKPLDDCLYGKSVVVLGRMGPDAHFAHSLPNAMMASSPRHAFWLLVIALAIERFKDVCARGSWEGATPEALTGPCLVKAAADFYLQNARVDVEARIRPVVRMMGGAVSIDFGELRVLQAETWYPVNWRNEIHQALRDDIGRKERVPADRAARWMFPGAYLVTYWAHSW